MRRLLHRRGDHAVTSHDEVVFLFDVDNALLDNDWIINDLSRHPEQESGVESWDRYLAILEALHGEFGYADYLGALQCYRPEDQCDTRLLGMSSFLVDYPFADRLYPGALSALEHARTWGKTVILSDGDVVFQPRKVEGSGLWGAVEGRILIYVHREQMLLMWNGTTRQAITLWSTTSCALLRR
jgi:FMN phosphatase YigB (HAD superfamily)